MAPTSVRGELTWSWETAGEAPGSWLGVSTLSGGPPRSGIDGLPSGGAPAGAQAPLTSRSPSGASTASRPIRLIRPSVPHDVARVVPSRRSVGSSHAAHPISSVRSCSCANASRSSGQPLVDLAPDVEGLGQPIVLDRRQKRSSTIAEGSAAHEHDLVLFAWTPSLDGRVDVHARDVSHHHVAEYEIEARILFQDVDGFLS